MWVEGAEGERRVEEQLSRLCRANGRRIMDKRIEELGAAIRDVRQARGMSQAKLAAMIGTDQAAISRIENGGCGVGIASYIKIADALGVKLGSLVGF